MLILLLLIVVGLAGHAEWTRRRVEWQIRALGISTTLQAQALQTILVDDVGARFDAMNRALIAGVAPLAGMTDLRGMQSDLEGHVTDLVTTKLDTLQQTLLKPAPWWAPPAWDQGKATPPNQRIVHLVLMDTDEREVHDATTVPLRQRPNVLSVGTRRYRCSSGSAAEGYYIYRLEAQ